MHKFGDLLDKPFTKETKKQFIDFLQNDFLKGSFKPVFDKDGVVADYVSGLSFIKQVNILGSADNLKDLIVLEIIKRNDIGDSRIGLTKEIFKLIANKDFLNKPRFNVLAIVRGEEPSKTWRFSLITSEGDKKSSPKRFSFLLGEGEKVKTVKKNILEPLGIKDFEDLVDRFDVEVVRKEFFALYMDLFLELYGEIKDNDTFKVLIEQGKIEPVSFAKNLMGKMIFLYFIQKKGWLGIKDPNGKFGDGDRDFFKNNFDNLAHQGNLFRKSTNFYNDFLEPLFYSGLNKKNEHDWNKQLSMKVPYLNGGLFEEEYDWENTVINLDNSIFKSIIDCFDTYNFTIDEDDPIDREIAVDPEMLGKIFESMISVKDENIDEILESYIKAKKKSKLKELSPDNVLSITIGKQINKDLGAFYTPREIVKYMTTESLIGFLSERLSSLNGEPKEKINEVIKTLFEYKEKHLSQHEIEEDKINGYNLIKKYVFDVRTSLKEIKILDPAVGSGAFPMGVLQEIVGLNRYLIDTFHLDNESDFEIKKQIIQNNIYGIDVDPGAVDIARLRFRLSLIVDSDNPVPLPNLDFKFVCANSLISLNEGGLFVNENFIKNLKDIKERFFSCCDHTEKERLKKDFMNEKLSLFSIDRDYLNSLRGKDGRITESYKNAIADMAKGVADKKNKQMLERDPFDTQKVNSRFDPKMMFDVEYFDIIIANPPYIGEKGHKEIFQKVAETKLGKYYLGKMDYFYFFFHLALDLGKEGSQVAFITTNYYPTALGARKLRKDFKERAIIKKLINFNELKIFESALGQHNVITILQKGEDINEKCTLINVNKQGLLKREAFYDIIGGSDKDVDYNSIPQFELYEGDDNYIRLSKEESNSELSIILNKISEGNKLLGDICNVNTGIFTACDKVFIDDVENYPSKFKTNSLEKSLLKPLFKNSDVNRYYTDNNVKKLLIYHHEKAQYGIEEIPNIFNYLSQYKDILSNRKDNSLKGALKRGRWDVMALPKTAIDFTAPKIVAPQRSPRNTFGYNECERYAASDVFFITSPEKGYELKYILSLLNSKLYYLRLFKKGKRKGKTLELIAKPLSEIPIKKISEEEQKPFIDLIDKIIEKKKDNLEADTTDFENKIDQLVYKLYGLTDEEIQIVEDSMK